MAMKQIGGGGAMDETTKLDSPQKILKTYQSLVAKDGDEVGAALSSLPVRGCEPGPSGIASGAGRCRQHPGEVDVEKSVRKRTPKRIIHCSDGVVEEFSSEDSEDDETRDSRNGRVVDPKTLAWIPWVVYHSWMAGSTVLRYCDSLGEGLAWFFGITSPKYYYEIQEFQRMKIEEEEHRKRSEVDHHPGWADTVRRDGEALDGGVVTKSLEFSNLERPRTLAEEESPERSSPSGQAVDSDPQEISLSSESIALLLHHHEGTSTSSRD